MFSVDSPFRLRVPLTLDADRLQVNSRQRLRLAEKLMSVHVE